MKIRELRSGDREYLLDNFRENVLDIVAKIEGDVWEALGVDEVDHVFVIEDEAGNCGALMMIKQLPEDGPDSAFAWLVPGNSLDKIPLGFLRATKELGQRLMDAGPYNMVWSYVSSKSPVNIAWAVDWLGAEIVERNVKVEGREEPQHKVVLTRQMLQERQTAK